MEKLSLDSKICPVCKKPFTIRKKWKARNQWSQVVYCSENIDMSRVLSPVNPGSPGLNLISCFGDVIAGTSEFNERIVVFTELI